MGTMTNLFEGKLPQLWRQRCRTIPFFVSQCLLCVASNAKEMPSVLSALLALISGPTFYRHFGIFVYMTAF